MKSNVTVNKKQNSTEQQTDANPFFYLKKLTINSEPSDKNKATY